MLQVGSSWTTIPTQLPTHAGDAAVNLSVVFQKKNLLVLGAHTTTRECGVVLYIRNGSLEPIKDIPGIGTGGRYTWQSTGQALAQLVLVQDRFLYAIITNPNYKQLKNTPTPREEIYRADLHEYMTKGFLDNALDFLGGLYCAVGGGSPPASFWKPVLPIYEDSGASLAACTDSTAEHTLLFAVGGFQSLSPKFYQVFAAKESVSRAARMLRISNQSNTPSDWIRLPDMNVRRKNLATIIVANYLYAIGGEDEKGNTVSSVERINLSFLLQPTTDTAYDCHEPIPVWEPVANMITPRHQFAATATQTGIIIVAGGCNTKHGRLYTVECLLHTPQNNQPWKPLPRLQTPRMGAAIAILQEKIVVAGGTKTPGPFWGTGNLDTIETLDIVTSILQNNDTTPNALLPALPPISTNPPPQPPLAYAEVIIDEDAHGFVPVVHAPPTAPSHWHQPQSVATIPQYSPYASSASAPLSQAPSAPNAQQDYPIHDSQHCLLSSASTSIGPDQPFPFPIPIPPPQDKSMPAFSLPPPVPPPCLPSQLPVSRSEDDTSCAVCLERKKQVAFFCGHQACLHCSPQLQECHICRKPIQGRIQLYGD